MENTITKTDFNFPGQKNVYHGKVREVYNINDKLLIMIATDRISAFDVVLPRGIPYKGQVLNQVAAKFMAETADLVPNWIIDVPDPVVSIGRYCEPFKVEMVIRGYLSGHAWREYRGGKRFISGAAMKEGMKENDRFPEPIITPSTKADVGHDEDISRKEILEKGLVNEEDYTKLENFTSALYKRGSEIADRMGLILVDTKYEFGKQGGEIFLIDEIHTPDSSRYFYKKGYEDRQKRGEPQKQLSKEFVREWLMANGFQGKEGQSIPDMTDEFVNSVSERYIELYENLTGEVFIRSDVAQIMERVEGSIRNFLEIHF